MAGMGLQVILEVPSEWPFKGTTNLSASPSSLKFCAPGTRSGQKRPQFPFNNRLAVIKQEAKQI